MTKSIFILICQKTTFNAGPFYRWSRKRNGVPQARLRDSELHEFVEVYGETFCRPNIEFIFRRSEAEF